MKVTAWSASGTYGIRVGKTNRDRYFRSLSSVRVQIDEAVFDFPLSPSFWRNCPEFRGSEIGRWFRENQLAPWPKGHPPAFELIPLGGNRFRLVRS